MAWWGNGRINAVATGLLFVAIGAILGAAAPAAAFSDDDEVWFVSFAGSNEVTSIGPDGETSTDSNEQTVNLRCTPDACLYYEYYSGTDVPLSASNPSGSTSWPAEGDYCDRDEAWNGPGVATVSFAGTAVTIETRVEGSGWRDCPDAGRSAIFGQNQLLVAEWVEGELCVLTGDECPDLGGPAPVDAAAPVSDEPVSAASASRLGTGSGAAPSVLSGLATPAEAGTAPQQLALAALLTVILVLLVAFPTSLLNSAVETGSDRFSAWWGARRRRPAAVPLDTDSAGEPVARAPRTGTWWWAAAGVFLAGLISAFVDPQFGLNAGSARVLLSILVSFAIDVALGWVLVIWLVRRAAPGVSHSFVFRPITLIVVVAAVVFTRVTGFEPGIVFGLVAGVAFGALVGRGAQAKAALATLGYAFFVALIAWALYGLLGGGGATGESFWSTFLLETLSSVAIGGLAALPVALFPVRGMAGHTIWAWNRWVWGGCYALGLFAFFVVLMPMPFSWAGVALDLWSWIGIYLAYAVAAVVGWLLITRPWRRDDETDESPEVTDAGVRVPLDRLDG